MKNNINHLGANPSPISGRTRRLVLILTFGHLAVVAGVAMEMPTDSNAATMPVSTITVAAIEPALETGYLLQRRFVGRVEAQRTSAVGFESAGLLTTVVVDEGERVSAGEVLARLDTARLDAKRVELVAAHKAARAKLELAEQTLKRLEKVIERGLASDQQLDEARERVRSAAAELELAGARTDSIDIDIGKSELVAPFDAVVTHRYMDEGRVIAVGEPVLELQDIRAAEIRVGVAGPLVSALSKGQSYAVTINTTPIEATVKTVLPVRGAATRTVDVIFSLDKLLDHVLDGDLVTLKLADKVHEPGYWLPLDALSESVRGLWTVFTLIPAQTGSAATHEVVPQVVEILHTVADRVYVRAGMAGNPLLVAKGVHKVVPGQLVHIVDANLRLARGGQHDATE